jgi:hypothetical protein
MQRRDPASGPSSEFRADGRNPEVTKLLDKDLGPTWVQLLPKTMHLGPTRRTTDLNESTS